MSDRFGSFRLRCVRRMLSSSRLGQTESLVADQGQPGLRRTDTAGVREQLAGDLAFPGLRIGPAPGRRHLVRGGDQVRLQSPGPARMRGAVPVVRPTGQLRAPDGLPRGAARHRGWRRSAAPGRTTTGTAGPGSMRGLPLVGRIHLMGGPVGRCRVPVNPGIADDVRRLACGGGRVRLANACHVLGPCVSCRWPYREEANASTGSFPRAHSVAETTEALDPRACVS